MEKSYHNNSNLSLFPLEVDYPLLSPVVWFQKRIAILIRNRKPPTRKLAPSLPPRIAWTCMRMVTVLHTRSDLAEFLRQSCIRAKADKALESVLLIRAPQIIRNQTQ